MKPLQRILLALCATMLVWAGAVQAQPKAVSIGHQDALLPWRMVMESDELEKATGYKINWRAHGGGGDVIRALDADEVQIGEAGSSAIAAAASRGQDMQLVWILSDIAQSEALVARNGAGVNSVRDLVGKKVGTPFISTAHYQLMAALKLEGVEPKAVRVLNMRPAEIAAAWAGADIDAAFVWEPVLSSIAAGGKLIASSGDIGKKGFPTFDGLVVNASWAAANEAFVVALIKALAKADEDYRKNTASWTADSPQVKAVAKWSRADAKAVPAAMQLYRFPTPAEQLSPIWLGGGAAKALLDTATFLKEQGRVSVLKPSYAGFVNSQYLRKATGATAQ